MKGLKRLGCGILLLSLIFGTACGGNKSNVEKNKEAVKSVDTNQLVVSCLQVGKADSIFVQQGEHAMLIDTGEEQSRSVILQALEERGIDHLEYMVITHYDKDHVGSAAAVLESVNVDTVLCADYEGSNAEYASFVRATESHEDVQKVTEEMEFSLGDASYTCYPTSKKEKFLSSEAEYDNNMSLVVRMTFGQKNFLFTGDIENKRIKEMLKSDTDWSCDWIKMPHHGAWQKKIRKLLEAAQPQYAVISTSEERPTDQKTTEALEAMGIENYDTTDATIVTYCDGEKIWVEKL